MAKDNIYIMFYRLVSITAGLVLLILLSSASIVAAGENFSEGDSDVDKIVDSVASGLCSVF